MFQYLVVYEASGVEMQTEKIVLSSEQCLEGLQQIRQIRQTVRTK